MTAAVAPFRPAAVPPLCALLCRLLVLAATLALALPAAAQEPVSGRSFALIAAEWQRTFDAVERAMRARSVSDAQRHRFDGQLAAVVDDAQVFEAEARREMESQTRLLDALGAPPAAGAPPEPRDIARERKDIEDAIGTYRTRLAQAELAAARAAALRGELATTVRRHFLQRLLERLPSPLAPGVPAAAAAQAAGLLGQLLAAPVDWYGRQPPEVQNRVGSLLAISFVVGLGVLWALRRPLLSDVAARPGRTAAPTAAPTAATPTAAVPGEGDAASASVPPLSVRLRRAGQRTLAQGVLPAAALSLPIVVVFAASDLASAGLAADVLRGLLLAMGLFLGVAAFARAALRPSDEAMALLPLQRRSAERLLVGICLLAAVYGLEAGLRQATAELAVPMELQSARALVYAALVAVGVAAVLRSAAWRGRAPAAASAGKDAPKAGASAPLAEAAPETAGAAPPAGEDGPDGRGAAEAAGALRPIRIGSPLRHGVTALALAAPCAAALGYPRLAVTLSDNIIYGMATLAAALVIRATVLAGSAALLALPALAAPGAVGASLARAAVLWVRALLDPVLLGLAVYLLAPTWGVPQEDLARWGASLLAGFTIGGVNVSLTDIALAALVLVVALTATRALRRTLAERLLPRTRLDLSVQHSISVGAGYLGVVLAVLLAVAVVGIDLSSIALVAGALSVGIGFGLQAIVNNFVSGLILLIERPVKVGDWVVVGDHQGYVRRIHVRSTELETFERSTVILPNSELLSSAVVNWTHKDKVGRVDVRIGVDYGIDVEKVREVLLACARAHPEVLSWPRPQVFFLDFGDSALIFELRAFLRDVEKRLRVGSELRFAIDKAFRDAGIEFPYPQHDIHLHDIDRLEAAIASIGRAMQDRAVPAPRTPPAGRRGTRTGQGEPRA